MTAQHRHHCLRLVVIELKYHPRAFSSPTVALACAPNLVFYGRCRSRCLDPVRTFLRQAMIKIQCQSEDEQVMTSMESNDVFH